MFKDHYSGLTCAYLRQSKDGESTLEAKKYFEVYAWKHDVGIKHFHTDDGRFEDQFFIAHS